MVQAPDKQRTSPDPPAGLDAPTVAELGVEGDVEEMLANLIDPEASPGDALFDQQGTVIRHGKRRDSLATYDGKPLPDRVRVYDRHGRVSLVDTARLRYHLSKKGADGQPVFLSKPPPGITPPKYIEDTCEICLERGVRKRFLKRADWRIHHVRLHPEEWAAMQEDAAEERRRQDQALLLRVIGAGVSPTVVDAVQVNLEVAHCDACGWEKAAKNAELSLKAHQRLHCPARKG